MGRKRCGWGRGAQPCTRPTKPSPNPCTTPSPPPRQETEAHKGTLVLTLVHGKAITAQARPHIFLHKGCATSVTPAYHNPQRVENERAGRRLRSGEPRQGFTFPGHHHTHSRHGKAQHSQTHQASPSPDTASCAHTNNLAPAPSEWLEQSKNT